MLCAFLPRLWRYFVAALSGLLFLVDVFSLTHYNSVLDAGLLQVILATNPQEAVEYVVTQGGDILPLLVASILTGGALWWWKRRDMRSRATVGWRQSFYLSQQPFFINRRVKVMAMAVLVLLAGSACHAFADPEDSVEKLPRNLSVGRLMANLKQSYDENRSTAYIDYALASRSRFWRMRMISRRSSSSSASRRAVTTCSSTVTIYRRHRIFRGASRPVSSRHFRR